MSSARNLRTARVVLRIVVVVVGVLAVGEAVARLWLTSPSGQDFDAELGWVWRPGATVYNNSEGGAEITMNSLGLNDDEVGPKAGRVRLLGFGNSFMEAIQVPREANYTSLVEETLPNVDFVNLARSAMGPVHYPIVLRRFAARLEPDLLVVSVGPGDVVSLLDPGVTVHRDASGRIVDLRLALAAKDRLKGTFGPLLDHSALATYLMRRLKPVILDTLSAVRGLSGTREAAAGPAPAAPSDPARDHAEAVDRLTWVLETMRATAPLVVLSVPLLSYGEGRTVEPGSPDETAVYREAAARAGVPFVDAGPTMMEVYRLTGQPPHGFDNLRVGVGHLNEAGHEAVAAALSGWLLARLSSREEARR